ncbi:transcription factor BIM2-like isoform X3 [Magnolia sinica]|uniref:transcription factor BIM2-like isoform X3 n=1 Tax=Magnolia sinica TaxID=86752 RepID=UPI002657E354|nr:transcription factor BIM2-like isoform X3 [Magnolia sinica]
MEMLRSNKGLTEDEDDDDEDYVRKDGSSSQKGDSGARGDGRGNDQRANTPRSKHSATEQRRRSKINDRFQILRDLIPNSSDQKRDKASFLLEVIEYVQFLQEKVQKYETAFPGWGQDSMKLATWKHSQGAGENTADHSRAIKNGPSPGLMFAGKFDENIAAVPAMLANMQNPIESDSLTAGTPYKPMDHNPGLASKAVPTPMVLQQNMYPSSIGSSGLAQPPQRPMSDAENMASQPQPQVWPRQYPSDSDVLNEQEELMIEGGTIRMSSIYSQGLLTTLTQALQSSGVDLSQASISVQIDLGKRAITRPSTTKDHEDPSSSNRLMSHSRVASSGEDSDQAQKRLKMDNIFLFLLLGGFHENLRSCFFFQGFHCVRITMAAVGASFIVADGCCSA